METDKSNPSAEATRAQDKEEGAKMADARSSRTGKGEAPIKDRQSTTVPQEEEAFHGTTPSGPTTELAVFAGGRPPATPVKCHLSPDRCGTLRISFRGGAQSPEEDRVPDWDHLRDLGDGEEGWEENDLHERFLSPGRRSTGTETPGGGTNQRRKKRPTGGDSNRRAKASNYHPTDAFFRSPRESLGMGEGGSGAAVGGRKMVDFELPFQVAPYVKPLEAARRDFAARCFSSARRARQWSVDCVRRTLSSARDDALWRYLSGPLSTLDANLQESIQDEPTEATAEWTPVPEEVERAMESFGARAHSALIDFGKQLHSLEGARAAGGLIRASQTAHVLQAAKGVLMAVQRLYAAAASREHATFRKVLEDAVVQSGILGANLSRVLRDLDAELSHCLAAYRARVASVAAKTLLKCPQGSRTELEAVRNQAGLLAENLAQRLELSGNLFQRDAAFRLKAAVEETKHTAQGPAQKACALARLLRELKETAPLLQNPPSSSSQSAPPRDVRMEIQGLIARAKPVVRSTVACEVDLEGLQEELAQETARFVLELLEEAWRRCQAVADSSKMAFETHLDAALRDRDRQTASDAESWKNAAASLATYENRLALEDSESYYVLLHAKELLEQAVEASWCYDRLRIFADWIRLKDPSSPPAPPNPPQP